MPDFTNALVADWSNTHNHTPKSGLKPFQNSEVYDNRKRALTLKWDVHVLVRWFDTPYCVSKKQIPTWDDKS